MNRIDRIGVSTMSACAKSNVVFFVITHSCVPFLVSLDSLRPSYGIFLRSGVFHFAELSHIPC